MKSHLCLNHENERPERHHSLVGWDCSMFSIQKQNTIRSSTVDSMILCQADEDIDSVESIEELPQEYLADLEPIGTELSISW